MSWNQGGGGGPWGGGQSPWGRGPQQTNLDDIIRRGQDRVRRLLPGGGAGGSQGILLVALVIVVIWLFTGFYRVQPDEQGIVLRFGAFNRTSTPGLNVHWPWPIETAETPKVTRVNRVEIGFYTDDSMGRGQGRDVQIPSEALMLTGDENIVDINFTVFWVIKSAKDYLFSIRRPDDTVKVAAESAMREVIGRTEIASAFSEGRGKIETDTQTLLQEILDAYSSGIQVTQVQLQKVDPPTPVIDAFRDVQSAKIDEQTAINNAQTYCRKVVTNAGGDPSACPGGNPSAGENLPKTAGGEAASIRQAAEAYRQQVRLQAEGDASRFLAVYAQYKAAPDITARRLYIETMESILKKTNKVILDKAASGAVPYLPLPAITQPPAAGAATASPAMSGGRQ